MSKGINIHHDGKNDIYEIDGNLKIDIPSDNEDSSTTGSVTINSTDNQRCAFMIYSNNSSSSGYPLTKIYQDNASASQDVFEIHNDGAGKTLFLDSDGALSDHVFHINHSNTLASGKRVFLIEASTAVVDKYIAEIHNDGEGVGLFMNQDGDGIALSIDSESTSEPSIKIDQNISDDKTSFRLLHGGTDVFWIKRLDALNDNVVMRLGNSYLWVDSTGDLRIHSSKPTADTSGSVVGSQS